MRGSPVNFTGFSGGVNYADEPYNLGTAEARDLLNVVATGRGSVRKRDGASTVAATVAGGFTTMGTLELSSGARFLIGAGGTSVYSVTAGGVVADLAWTSTPTSRWSFAQAPTTGTGQAVYGSSGTDNPFLWTGTGAAAAAAIPHARYLRYKANRLWSFNMPGGYTPTGGSAVADPRSAITWSDLGAPQTTPAANLLLLAPNDGEEIMGTGALGDFIVVFKRSRTWVIYDFDTGANRAISESVGCASPRSIASGREGVFFLSNSREVVLTNGATMQVLSDRVRPLLQQIPSSTRDLARGVYFDGHYYLTFDALSGSYTLDYDTRLNAWFVHSYAPLAWRPWAPGNEPHLYASRPATLEQAFSAGTLTDGAAAFDAYWRGPFHTFNQSFVNKRVRRIAFDGSGFIRVSVSTDFRDTYSFEGHFSFQGNQQLFGVGGQELFGTGTDPFGGDLVEVGVAEVLTPGVARAWSVEFGNNTADPFTVDSYTFFINFRKSRSTT